VLNINIEVSPMASIAFKQGPVATNQPRSTGSTATTSTGNIDAHQKWLTNRLLRATERLLATCLDAEALVITPGQWVWHIHLSIVVLDAGVGGNVMDAAWYAAVAAVQHYRQPQTMALNSAASTTATNNNNNSNSNTNNENNPLAPPVLISLDAKEGTPLPLHQIPMAVSFCAMSNSSTPGGDVTATTTTTQSNSNGNSNSNSNNNKLVWLVDPSHVEEMLAVGHVTYALNVHQEICWVDFGITHYTGGGGGGGSLGPHLPTEELQKVALQQVQRLATALQDALSQADARAVEQRLALLKQTQQIQPYNPMMMQDDDDEDPLPPLPEGDLPAPPSAVSDTQEDEFYRQQALDYNIGHVAQPLAQEEKAEGDGGAKKKSRRTKKPPSTLLATLLQQATSGDTLSSTTADTPESRTPVDTPTTQSSAAAAAAAAAPAAMDEDDDEEETTMQLQSEFAAVPTPKSGSTAVQTPTPVPTPMETEDDDDDVDDLAAAIKTKKKKKRNKK
jgi:exosome complex RNA-binding protein Rrp42 (RNase PH superfamily)